MRLDRRMRLGKVARRARGDRDLRALFGQREAIATADAARTAGDRNDLAREIEIHGGGLLTHQPRHGAGEARRLADEEALGEGSALDDAEADIAQEAQRIGIVGEQAG